MIPPVWTCPCAELVFEECVLVRGHNVDRCLWAKRVFLSGLPLLGENMMTGVSRRAMPFKEEGWVPDRQQTDEVCVVGDRVFLAPSTRLHVA
jgi:hypothetical protein